MKLSGKPCLLLLPILAFVWAVWFFGLTKSLDRSFFDRCTVATEKSFQAPTNGVLVLIDEASLKEIGQRYSVRWPWPRSLFGALIASLHQAGAKKIVMDFEFFEPSEDSMQDDVLAAYSAACPETILGYSRISSPTNGPPQIKTPIFWPDTFQKQYPQFAVQSRMGLVDFTPDSDGVYRHYPMHGSLAAQATVHIPEQTNSLLRWYGGLNQLPTNAVLSAAPFVVLGVKLQEDLRDKKFDETDPASIERGLATLSPLEGSIAALVRDKVVFVGANASGTVDLKATPVGKIEPGVLVNYTAWANAEQNCFIQPFSALGNLFLSALLAFAVILVGWRYTSAAALAGIAALLIALLLAGSFAAFRAGIFFAPTTAIFGIFFAALTSAVHNFWRESARKREIQGIFGSYVSKEVVEKLLKNPEAIKLGGEKKELTVFFSDLAGFTDLSEKISPEELVQVVNRYLAAMTDFILDNGGYVDKYIGDAVMGVFGSPEPLENHAAAACRAAIACRNWMATAFQDAPVKLHARIGLNTGPMIVGNVGSERKKNFTVLGDAVNLASRLEAANKDVGTILLIGEDTERMARGKFVTRPIARLRVKGKLQPNQVYELICEAGDASVEESSFVAAYRAGYGHYLKREFAAAREHFLRAKTMRPDDKMTQCYLDNLAEFEHQQPAADWDGVLILKSK
ncbi:MAG TPA: adenylate/guanylate cyclase domain-containing protein [Verrucomicrobiae bacterium]